MVLFGETTNRAITFAEAGEGGTGTFLPLFGYVSFKDMYIAVAIGLILIVAAFVLIPIIHWVWRRYKNQWPNPLRKVAALFIDAAIACAVVAILLEVCDESIFAFLSPKRSDGFIIRLINLLWVSGAVSLVSLALYAGILMPLHRRTRFPRWLPLPPWTLNS